MNHLEELTFLRNRYFGIRHGQAESNVDGVVVGDPKVGIVRYGLTKTGQWQVMGSVTAFPDLDSDCLIYSSDFLRARQTAEIAATILGIEGVVLTEALRERFFGKFEGTSSASYDFVHNTETPELYSQTGVESREAIFDRTTRLVRKLEQEHADRKIILVSHGDPLYCLEQGFMKIPPIYAFDQVIMKNAEVREFKLKN